MLFHAPAHCGFVHAENGALEHTSARPHEGRGKDAGGQNACNTRPGIVSQTHDSRITVTIELGSMSGLKPTLKRGALMAAANWQITLIQAVADSLFKLLLAVPIIGGVFLVGLVLGAEPTGLMTLDWRELITTIVTALLSHPVVLTMFLLALAVVVVGGSVLVFLVKGGTVATLVESDQHAGPIEQPPLHFSAVARAGRFTAEGFIQSCSRLFARFARLGFGLMTVYLMSGATYLSIVIASRATGDGWGLTALFTALFVCWITLVNLVYLLLQIVIAADDCGVATAVRRVATFVRAEMRSIATVFGVVLALVVCATGASILATAALGLIGFIPLLGLAVLPLQLSAWLLRGIVFQYLGLTAIGAYLQLYRGYARETVPGQLTTAPTYS
jgi:hypothetical protein